MAKQTQTIWRPIPGYEGRYEISNTGQVRSLDRWAKNGKHSRSKHRGKTIRLFKHYQKNYVQVCLWRNHQKQTRAVHVLVALVFIGERPEGLQIHHKDHDKGNNHIDNLEYVTQSQNIRAGFAAEVYDKSGEKNPRSILTAKDVRIIRGMIKAEQFTYAEIGAKFGVTKYTIFDINSGRSWSQVAGYVEYGAVSPSID